MARPPRKPGHVKTSDDQLNYTLISSGTLITRTVRAAVHLATYAKSIAKQLPSTALPSLTKVSLPFRWILNKSLVPNELICSGRIEPDLHELQPVVVVVPHVLSELLDIEDPNIAERKVAGVTDSGYTTQIKATGGAEDIGDVNRLGRPF